MTKISLSEFKELSGFSDTSILWLLCNNKLPCSYNEESGIFIDIDCVEYHELIHTITTGLKEHFEAAQPLIKERFATIIRSNLASIMERAISKL